MREKNHRRDVEELRDRARLFSSFRGTIRVYRLCIMCLARASRRRDTIETAREVEIPVLENIPDLRFLFRENRITPLRIECPLSCAPLLDLLREAALKKKKKLDMRLRS